MGTGNKAAEESTKGSNLVVLNGELLLILQNFNAAFETVMHEDWNYTQYQIGGMGNAETFLKPTDGGIGENHEALLYWYEKLQEQLSKKQFRILPSSLSSLIG